MCLDLLLEQLAPGLVVHLLVLGLAEEGLQQVALLHNRGGVGTGFLAELDGLPEIDQLVLLQLLLHFVHLCVPEADMLQYHVDHLGHYIVPECILLIVEQAQQDARLLLHVASQHPVDLSNARLDHLRLYGLDNAT